MVWDCPGADEQANTDLRIGQAVGSQAAGSPGSGIVELGLPRDETAGFQLVERSHDGVRPASDSAVSVRIDG